jgi:hypothetical protein
MVGQNSILFGQTWGDVDLRTHDGKKRYNVMTTEPIWKIKTLLGFWFKTGIIGTQGILKRTNGTQVIPTYLIVPPMWLSAEEAKEFYGDNESFPKIPLSVDVQNFKALFDLKNTLKSISQKPGIMNLNVTVNQPDGQERNVEDPYVFRKEGRVWNVTYMGETTHIDHVKGLYYIAYLLRNPGLELHVLELVRLVEKPDGESDPRKLSQDELDSENLRRRKFGGRIEALDDTDIKRIKRQYEGLCYKRDQAKKLGDNERAESIQQEINALYDQYLSPYSIGKKGRYKSPEAEQARTNVLKLLQKAYERIGEENPFLAKFLRDKIDTREYLIYKEDPENSIRWKL